MTKECNDKAALRKGHGPGGGEFKATIKPRLSTAPPSAGAAKFLPGYGGFVPGQRFMFETSEGTLARTWAPRTPEHSAMGGGHVTGGSYKPSKPRVKLPVDKHIIGYTGNLPGYQNHIEISYSRIARGIEDGSMRNKPTEHREGVFNPSSASSMKVSIAKPPPEYKLPGYTGYIPQTKYTFEQRYSTSVEMAKKGVVGGAGYRMVNPNVNPN